MPTYEYVCSECQNKFDVFATLAQKEKGLKPECPNCHSKKTIQSFGNFVIAGGSKAGTNANSTPCCSNAGPNGCKPD